MPSEPIDTDELRALVLGFLQQTFGEYRQGISLRDFERLFPERCDEEKNWYRRYGAQSTIEALQMVPDVARIRPFQGSYMIALNQASADEHLVDLISKQRSKKPKRRSSGPPQSPWHSLYHSRKNNPAIAMHSSYYSRSHPTASSAHRTYQPPPRRDSRTTTSSRTSTSSSPSAPRPLATSNTNSNLAWNGRPFPSPTSIPVPDSPQKPQEPQKPAAASTEAPTRPEPPKKLESREDFPLSLFKSLKVPLEPEKLQKAVQPRQPLVPVQPKKSRIIKIEEQVKLRTMRLIVTRPLSGPLKISDWQREYENHTNHNIKVSTYGFRSVEDFFRELEKELPIRITDKYDLSIRVTTNQSPRKQEGNRELYAEVKSDVEFVQWLKDKMMNRKFEAIISLGPKFELVATPNDTYKFRKLTLPYYGSSLEPVKFVPVRMRSCKDPSRMWLHLDNEFEADLLEIQSKMCAYRDYRKSKMLPGLPKYFITEGFPCAAFDQPNHHSEARWCRALIISVSNAEFIEDAKVTCLLVDYGVTRTYVAEQLSCILKAHLAIPVVPILARLVGVEPIDPVAGWSKLATALLSEYISSPIQLACEFKNAILLKTKDYFPDTLYEVDLCDIQHPTADKYLRHLLIEAEVAKSALPAADALEAKNIEVGAEMFVH